MIEKITDEIIALTVVGAATGCGVYVTYLTGATEQHEPLLGHLMRVGARVARQTGISEGGFRIALNQGVDAGQIVDHLHLHVLGGGLLD